MEIPKVIKPMRLAKAQDSFLFTAMMLALRLDYYRRNSEMPARGWDPPVTEINRDGLQNP